MVFEIVKNVGPRKRGTYREGAFLWPVKRMTGKGTITVIDWADGEAWDPGDYDVWTVTRDGGRLRWDRVSIEKVEKSESDEPPSSEDYPYSDIERVRTMKVVVHLPRVLKRHNGFIIRPLISAGASSAERRVHSYVQSYHLKVKGRAKGSGT